MQRPRFLLFIFAAALSTNCATSKPQPTGKEMIPLDGTDPVFAFGRKTLPYSKVRCFDAVRATFKNTGHGLERQDFDSGKIISGKTTVYRGIRASNAATHAAVTVDNKFYVSVHGNETSCDVSVDKLRVWSGTVEVDTRTSSWIKDHLTGFMKGVEQELADAP